MSKSLETITNELLEPFDPFDIEWRVQQAGESNGKKWALVLAYVTNRAIMERLDSVFGVGGWQNEYQFMPDGGVVCGLKCLILNPVTEKVEWIVKYDGADKTAIEATKGGLSSAMKRAGVQWGIGRYLYRLDTTFVNLKPGRPENDNQIHAYVDKAHYHFDRPKLPSFALPGGTQ